MKKNKINKMAFLMLFISSFHNKNFSMERTTFSKTGKIVPDFLYAFSKFAQNHNYNESEDLDCIKYKYDGSPQSFNHIINSERKLERFLMGCEESILIQLLESERKNFDEEFENFEEEFEKFHNKYRFEEACENFEKECENFEKECENFDEEFEKFHNKYRSEREKSDNSYTPYEKKIKFIIDIVNLICELVEKKQKMLLLLSEESIDMYKKTEDEEYKKQIIKFFTATQIISSDLYKFSRFLKDSREYTVLISLSEEFKQERENFLKNHPKFICDFKRLESRVLLAKSNKNKFTEYLYRDYMFKDYLSLLSLPFSSNEIPKKLLKEQKSMRWNAFLQKIADPLTYLNQLKDKRFHDLKNKYNNFLNYTELYKNKISSQHNIYQQNKLMEMSKNNKIRKEYHLNVSINFIQTKQQLHY